MRTGIDGCTCLNEDSTGPSCKLHPYIAPQGAAKTMLAAVRERHANMVALHESTRASSDLCMVAAERDRAYLLDMVDAFSFHMQQCPMIGEHLAICPVKALLEQPE